MYPQLGLVSELRLLAGKAEVVIDVDHKKERPETDPCERSVLTAVQSKGTPFTLTLCLLPFNPGRNIDLDAHCPKIPHEPFVRDFIEGLAEVYKDYIHGPRTVTLTEHVVVKVKEVCSIGKTFPDEKRVDEVITY